jgi:hypothetical protein
LRCLEQPLARQEYSRHVPKRRHAWVGFALFGVLAVLGMFVLGGIAAGVASFAAMMAFIGACIYALRGEDPESVAHNNRTGVRGWFGGWF